MSSPPSVDVCIVNYFGAAEVREAVRTLGPWPHGKVWLVDNSADAAEAQALVAIPGTELLLPGANLGFGRGCNLAFERSASEFFLLLNPDARIDAGDVLKLAETMRAQPRLGALSPRIWWNPERSFLLPAAFPQTPLVALAQNLASRFRAATLSVASRQLMQQRRMMGDGGCTHVGFLAGAVLLLRRRAAEDAGGLFDADYFMFYEDSDLSLRLRSRGWQLAVDASADAVHEYRHKAFKGPLMMQARDVYFRKHHPRFHRQLPRVDSLARPVPLPDWFDVLPQPCRTLDEFARQTQGAAVDAFSPSPLTMPAIFRPGAPTPFTPAEWDLLEPAGYAVRLAGRPRWAWLERT